jgi:hypothetical protein
MNDDGRHQTACSSIFDEAVVGKKGDSCGVDFRHALQMEDF